MILDEPFVGLWIVNGHFVIHVAEIRPREFLDQMQFGTVGMGIVQHGVTVCPDRIDHQCVSLPVANGVAKPRWVILGIFRVRTAIDRHDGKPRILFEEERKEVAVLHHL